MANDFYNASGAPVTGSAITSSVVRAELDSIEAGFDKVSPLTGKAGLPVFVNAGATAQETKSISAAQTALGMVSPTGNGGKPIFVNAGGTAYETKTITDARTALLLAPVSGAGGLPVFVNAGATAEETKSIANAQTALGIKANALSIGAVGRDLRVLNIFIEDGTPAATVNVEGVALYNCSAITKENSLGKSGDTGSFRLDISGSILSVETAALSGTADVVIALNVYNSTGTAIQVTPYHDTDTGLMSFTFYNAATGANLDITTLVNTGTINLKVSYITH